MRCAVYGVAIYMIVFGIVLSAGWIPLEVQGADTQLLLGAIWSVGGLIILWR